VPTGRLLVGFDRAPDTARSPAPVEALAIRQGQHKRQSRDRTHAEYTLQGSGVGILFFGDRIDLLVVAVNVLTELGNLLDNRQHRGAQFIGQLLAAAGGKATGITRGRREPKGFTRPRTALISSESV
jgi:hypothetical protein